MQNPEKLAPLGFRSTLGRLHFADSKLATAAALENTAEVLDAGDTERRAAPLNITAVPDTARRPR